MKSRYGKFAIASAALYALISGLYIVYSDRLLEKMVTDTENLTRFQTYKGWIFVVTTALLLYFILRTYSKRLYREIKSKEKAMTLSESLTHITNKLQKEVFMFDLKSLKYIWANEKAIKNMGFTLTELKKLTPVDISPEYTTDTYKEMLSALTEKKHDILTFKTYHRRKNATIYRCDVSLQVINYMGTDCFLDISLDTTERDIGDKKVKTFLQKNDLIAEISREIIRRKPFAEVVQNTCSKVKYLLPWVEVMFTLENPDLAQWQTISSSGPQATGKNIIDDELHQLLLHNDRIDGEFRKMSNDVKHLLKQMFHNTTSYFVLFPLAANNKLYGVMVISAYSPDNLTNEEKDSLSEIAELICTAIDIHC